MQAKHNFIDKLWKSMFRPKEKSINVYFVSGMCYNCKVFDEINLPAGYNKIYIEWLIPTEDETLTDYTARMAEAIDKHQPFILVGYSFGGTIVQEMNKLMSPQKSIIISSFKGEDEKPRLFKFAESTSFIERIPNRLFLSSDFFARLFNRYVCDLPLPEIEEYMTVVDPAYVKWAMLQIIKWKPTNVCPRLYHIHGTADPVFPYENLQNAYPVNRGDHLMILRRHEDVNSLLNTIIQINE